MSVKHQQTLTQATSTKTNLQQDWSREFKWSEDEFTLVLRHPSSESATKDANTALVRAGLAGVGAVLDVYGDGMRRNLERFRDTGLLVKAQESPELGGPLLLRAVSDLFPWMPIYPYELRHRIRIPVDRILESVRLADALPGQVIPVNLPIGGLSLIHHSRNVFAERDYDSEIVLYEWSSGDQYPTVELVSYELLELSFIEGSIIDIAKIKKKVRSSVAAFLGSALFATAIGTGGAEWLTDVRHKHETQQRIEQHLAAATTGQPATEFCGARFSLDALRNANERTFYYSEPGISQLERGCRLAAEQIEMKMMMHTDLKVDGQLGPRTREHEKRLGEMTHTSGRNSDEIFRGVLVENAHRLFAVKKSPDEPADPNP